MNDTSRFSSSNNHGYVPSLDAELRLGHGAGEPQRASNAASHVCSHCTKSFTSLQALGGHQTAHRKEMDEIRRKHVASAIEAKGPTSPAPLLFSEGKTAKSETSASRHVNPQMEETESVDLELTLATGAVDLTLRL